MTPNYLKIKIEKLQLYVYQMKGSSNLKNVIEYILWWPLMTSNDLQRPAMTPNDLKIENCKSTTTYVQPVSYKRYFRCNNSFLLLVFTINRSLSTDLVDPPPMGTFYMKHELYKMKASHRQSKNFIEYIFELLVTSNWILQNYAFMFFKWKLVTQAILKLLSNTLLPFWWPLITPKFSKF